ncbi:MAG TPA: alpha/beta hydrolase [Chryseolinea sp.]|nr:alpha/beta hydrolase [Chryseolinea sp.]
MSYALLLFTLSLVADAQTPTPTADSVYEKSVKIGYHSLYARSTGPEDARLTVVFESGAGGNSKDWEHIQMSMPEEVRTIAYDRAGVGKSDVGPMPRTFSQEALELHEMLKSLDVSGPVILVGQSIGGLLARVYVEQYGQNVAGLVLLDPTHESSMLGSMRYGGWTRLREKATGHLIPIPQLLQRISPGYDSTVDYAAGDFQKIYLMRMTNPTPLGNRPLIVVGAGIRKQPPGTPDDQWKELRSERDSQIQDLTSLSDNSRFILDTKSGHSIHIDNPTLVAQAIGDVIQAVRTKKKL